ncbi:preprotein translocase subunit SecG [Mucilaginibacter sp. BT774]|uniref:preprotein translocase subunit SecG n=1 Tax=Mucilaginibacter sp. BT774 TaxID=3062276 RepID=UPI002674CD88|nr:preprotein translocase subunit SecG [Mucilaginibacter sp. BT774]MDO3626850.1 preprotein translocase subunit SecG [Mucilaginibacter sp. BT774]
MYLILVILAVVVCVLLGAIVLIQNPKGGGLTSNFSSSSQLMGVQKTGDFLEKGTWILAISLMVLSLAINISVKGGSAAKIDNSNVDQIEQKASKPTVPTSTQPAPLNIPATGSTGSTGKK